MSEHGFHVHGPHDHAVEHAAAHGDDPFASRIAAMTAVLATIGALFSYEGGATQNDALIYKNEATIRKTEASDQWNYYQAKGNKRNLAELASNLAPAGERERYQKEMERYKGEQAEIKAKADALEARSLEAEKKSEESMHQHHRWAQAMTAVQVSISLAAITLLARRRWLEYACLGVAGVGAVLAGLALAHI